MRRLCLAISLSTAAACSSGSARPPRRPAAVDPPVVTQPPVSWCGAVKAALGADTAHFECLSVPNFLVTGSYGTSDNPERSDFVNSCFGGSAELAGRVRLSARPAGDLAFEYRTERSVDASGGLDLGFLGPWAPRLELSSHAREQVAISVSLGDAEIRVLSSVAEILGQQYQQVGDEASLRDSLESCITSLCDDDGLVYTSKVLAAVPVIRVRFSNERTRSGGASILGGIAGFDVGDSKTEAGAVEIRAKEKLNVAALLDGTRAAFERAGTCGRVAAARARRHTIASLKEFGIQLLAGRELGKIPPAVAALRSVVTGPEHAFSQDEQMDILATLEAIESASRYLASDKPDKGLCETRGLIDHMLGGDGKDNRLHDVLSEVAQPIQRRLTRVANDHSLPCAEPVWYLDADRDGYGDHEHVIRSAAQPEGYVANALDCYDHNAAAHPGQTGYFTEQRGDGSFDYDCDGSAARKDEIVSAGCRSLTTFGYPTHCWADAGWQDRVPGCGHEGRWLAECDVSGFSCSVVREERRLERCR